MAVQARYFVALVPPEPVFSEVMRFKKEFAEKYQSQGALRSPPHITLHMPFLFREDRQDRLLETIEKIDTEPFFVHLKDFSCFSPRVVYIDVVPSHELHALYLASAKALRLMGIHNAGYRDQGFVPHITIGFRDLKPAMFQEAWEVFSKRSYEARFQAIKAEVLKHNGKIWEQIK